MLRERSKILRTIRCLAGRLVGGIGALADKNLFWVGPKGEDFGALDSEFERKARWARAKWLGSIVLVGLLLRLAFWLCFGPNVP